MTTSLYTKTAQQQTTMLVVVDPRVKDPLSLIQGVKSTATALLLDPEQDSIPQITAALAKGNYTSLHLVSHGSPGCLHLGSTKLTVEKLPSYRQQLMEWGVAEILIYGCNVAAAPQLLMELQSLTGAKIAASTQKVGAGYWDLEWHSGEISPPSAFSDQLRQEYEGQFVATFDLFTTDEDTLLLDLDVLANDLPDPVTVASVNSAFSAGTVTPNMDGTIDYDPGSAFDFLAVGETRVDFFFYTASDESTAMVLITIAGVNDDPDAVDDGGAGFSTDENSSFTTRNVLLNDRGCGY